MALVRGLANLLTTAGLVTWSLAFYFGPEQQLIWKVGEYGGFAVIVSIILHIVSFMLPSGGSSPRRRKTKEEPRKCTICGRPAVPGSSYCRYHTDEMRQSARDQSRPPNY